jgi:hypothetical protein
MSTINLASHPICRLDRIAMRSECLQTRASKGRASRAARSRRALLPQPIWRAGVQTRGHTSNDQSANRRRHILPTSPVKDCEQKIMRRSDLCLPIPHLNIRSASPLANAHTKARLQAATYHVPGLDKEHGKVMWRITGSGVVSHQERKEPSLGF